MLSPQDGEHGKDVHSPLLLSTVQGGKKMHTDWEEEMKLSHLQLTGLSMLMTPENL